MPARAREFLIDGHYSCLEFSAIPSNPGSAVMSTIVPTPACSGTFISLGSTDDTALLASRDISTCNTQHIPTGGDFLCLPAEQHRSLNFRTPTTRRVETGVPPFRSHIPA